MAGTGPTVPPEAAVVAGRVLERKPQPDAARRLRVEERAVLVRHHHAADGWLLEDVHALARGRPLEPCGRRGARRSLSLSCRGVARGAARRGRRHVPRESSRLRILALRLKERKTGSRSCIAWPNLLSERAGGRSRLPSLSTADSSRKKEMFSPLFRKYSSVVLPWFRVLRSGEEMIKGEAWPVPLSFCSTSTLIR